MSGADQILADTWRTMLPGDRRALCLISYCNTLERRLARGEFVTWFELETADRMAIVRGMRIIGELAHQCSRALERVRTELER